MHGTLAQGAETRKDWTVISVLDSMDWMSADMVADCMASYARNLDRKKGRIFWRSAAADIHSPSIAQFDSKLIETPDRVGWYLSQWVANVGADFNVDMLPASQKDGVEYKNTLLQDAQVGLALFSQAMQKEKDVAAFYAKQFEAYDGFREGFLVRRREFMCYAVPWAQKVKTLVSVGCGTARDLEFVLDKIRTQGTHVYLVDLSADLLAMAKKRVEKAGIDKQVTIVCGDFTTPAVRKQLPAEVDVVTCSYCLTMIPDWQKALEAMVKLLKTDGHLCLVDFTSRSTMSYPQKFYRWWFSNDGVFFERKHVEWMKGKLQTVFYNESEHRVPYVPLWPTHYIFVGKKTK
jgi:ubiquinone/menaquinone biosynthesis C-methylase UbiE